MKLAITGSQVVGLLPIKVMLDAADYYTGKENLFIVDEDQKLRLVRNVIQGFYLQVLYAGSV